ncbi:regulator [Paenibacillus darwinianus]|uniref:Regulator n=1 Tax=Paenibacillus darwinianus TaxID=1380763 RepID=A0A9W5W7K0_9BACL|nr:LytTR family DNA-binding domain-containing protein [Paenibacillus darwinianus]EXX89142.1 regulator [Paenibacillus darwinianus]EXX89536.1 regulator [Paenibacillus darwinianus]EXX89791.1 regulator [Paenibacillus darwinianus]
MNGPVKALVVDDELYSRQELTHLLKRYDLFTLAGEADTGGKALELIFRAEPDVVFLDIELPDMTGLDLAHAIMRLKSAPLIVFATAFPDYALPAFRYEAIDYLLKPFDEEQLHQTVQRIAKHISGVGEAAKEDAWDVAAAVAKAAPAKLAVEEEGKIVYLVPADIIYIASENGMSHVYTRQHKYVTKLTLKELEQKLREQSFLRIHKSFLVNLALVIELTPWFHGAYQLKVSGRNESIPVSRNYVKELRERLEL